jgi:hypothetical protein
MLGATLRAGRSGEPCGLNPETNSKNQAIEGAIPVRSDLRCDVRSAPGNTCFSGSLAPANGCGAPRTWRTRVEVR